MNRNIAMRTEITVRIDGADITEAIAPSLLSLDYTDNEADAADDLQVRFEDTAGLWRQKWAAHLVDSAVTETTVTQSGQTTALYRVTAKIGLNVRAGRGVGYAKYGALCYGATVEVLGIESGWAEIVYGGKTAYVSASYITPAGGSSASGTQDTGSTRSSARIAAAIILRNPAGDGKDAALDCGEFELDSINESGPPATVTLKGTSLPYDSGARQTLKTKVWESYRLSGIADEIARRAGMTCLYLSEHDPQFERREQYRQSDVEFLAGLCAAEGISLKCSNNILILFDQAAYEKRDSVRTVRYGDGTYTRYKMATGKADTEYQSCRVSYTDPETGKSIVGTAYAEGYDAKAKENQQLNIVAKVSSAAEAERLARMHLRLHNKYSATIQLTMPGAPDLVGGVNVTLEGWGLFDGKYVVKKAKHSVGESGYTTTVELRRALEGSP